MKKLSVIAGMMLTLAGCGSDKSDKNSNGTAATPTPTPTEASGTVATADQPPEVPEEPTAESFSSNAVFIECKYRDRSIVNYKIQNNIIYAFNEANNIYVDNAVYTPSPNFFRDRWSHRSRSLSIIFQENNEYFDIDFVYHTRDNRAVKISRDSINRKTGTVSTTEYERFEVGRIGSLMPGTTRIIAQCSPSANMVIEQNRF